MAYICKTASREELVRRWEYLIRVNAGDRRWVRFREDALRHFDEKSTISYLGILDGEIICEATAVLKESALWGDISDPSGLLSEGMCYLAAFRTNPEQEGKGYFRRLYDYLENDLLEQGYTELSLGVGPESVRNMEIYFHLGFREYIKTVIQYEPSGKDPSVLEEDVILFYKKKIR